MKRLLFLLLGLTLGLVLCACADTSLREGTAASGVQAVIDRQINGESGTGTESAPTAAAPAAAASPGVFYNRTDVDLTALSSTMVYSEVLNMMLGAEDYIGKVVKMSGQFACYEFPEINYYACIIADATACCQQGMEFVLAGDYSYPDDYPPQGTEVTVTGVFNLYSEGDAVYCHLTDAVMEY